MSLSNAISRETTDEAFQEQRGECVGADFGLFNLKILNMHKS